MPPRLGFETSCLDRLSGGGTDRHSAGVNRLLKRPTPATARGERRSGCYDPNDPRRGMLPRGRDGWPDDVDSRQE
jgi:hypothetical protein